MIFLANKKTTIFIVILLLALFLILYFLLILEESSINKVEATLVTKIIDGDTIVVQGGETVRLLGIDCDERGKQCYGEAKDYIEEVLLNQEIALEADFEDKDQYGRSLRYIFLNGKNFNEMIVREGYCVARFPSESKYQSEIQDAEEFAIKNKIGCKWKDLEN